MQETTTIKKGVAKIRSNLYAIEAIELGLLTMLFGSCFSIMMITSIFISNSSQTDIFNIILSIPLLFCGGLFALFLLWGVYLLYILLARAGGPIIDVGLWILMATITGSFTFWCWIILDINRLIVSKLFYRGEAPVEYAWSHASKRRYKEWKLRQKSVGSYSMPGQIYQPSENSVAGADVSPLKEARCKVQFNADGKVLSIEIPQGQWVLKQKGQNKYYTQKAKSLLQAAEILKKIGSIPQLTYYTVDSPDGSLGRDIQGYYTESPLKTENLTVESRCGKSDAIEFLSLQGFGDMQANQTTVALLKKNSEYSRLVLLMKCGHCGYESPVETQSGSLVRECYCCGVKNKGNRGTVTVFLGSSMVEI